MAVLDTIPFVWKDHTPSNPVDLGFLSRYKNILWLLNSQDYDYPDEELGYDLFAFFENGGNMMFAGFNPSKFLAGNTGYPYKFSEGYFINRYFKVDSVNRKISSLMYRAYPVADDYDTLSVDTNKSMIANYPGELYSIEVFSPTSEAKVIYRFDSHFPQGTAQGAMQDKAVGIEYMGNDFKTILLSFPLYYIDTSNAQKLMKYVMTEKFTHPVGMEPLHAKVDDVKLICYPNPFSSMTTFTFRLREPSYVNLAVYNMQGIRITQLADRKFKNGYHEIRFSAGNLPPGIYHAVLQTSDAVTSTRIVIFR
jgi:GR25 family glycosyltransferase involved in LPS biosynthesis